MRKRVEALRAAVQENGVDGVIVTKQQNWQYLSGFTGSNAILLVTEKSNILITDFRYIEQAAHETEGFKIVKQTGLAVDTLAEQVKELGLKKVGFEDDSVTYHEYDLYKKKIPDAELYPLHQVIEKIRRIKDSGEISLLQKAAEITDQAFGYIVDKIKPGVKESQISLELEYFMRQNGAEKPAFDTIVASGYRGALPHGIASNKEIEQGDLIVIDFGAVFQGYHADMTRTVVVGKPDRQQEEIYNLVLRAQMKALEVLKPGIKCSDVDFAARNIISNEGYGANFGHGLGHSVGLEIHESPSLSPRDDTVLEPGMVITVEPGVYLNGWGGVRIEDLVLVTPVGCKILSTSTKKLIQLQ